MENDVPSQAIFSKGCPKPHKVKGILDGNNSTKLLKNLVKKGFKYTSIPIINAYCITRNIVIIIYTILPFLKMQAAFYDYNYKNQYLYDIYYIF